MRGVMAGGEDLGTPDADGGQRGGGFPLSEACLLVGLDLIEEAVLEEGGGEAAAGLLRAMRTTRGIGVGAERGMGRGLAADGRGQVESGYVLPLVELLEKVRGGAYVGDALVAVVLCLYRRLIRRPSCTAVVLLPSDRLSNASRDGQHGEPFGR